MELVENVEKVKKNPGYQQCFEKASFSRSLKVRIVC